MPSLRKAHPQIHCFNEAKIGVQITWHVRAIIYTHPQKKLTDIALYAIKTVKKRVRIDLLLTAEGTHKTHKCRIFPSPLFTKNKNTDSVSGVALTHFQVQHGSHQIYTHNSTLSMGL